MTRMLTPILSEGWVAFLHRPLRTHAVLFLACVGFFLFFHSEVSAVAQNAVCVVCEQTISQGNVWQHARGLICEKCIKIERRCWACGLPVFKEDIKTTDGRLLCKYDAPLAVLKAHEAEKAFEETRLDVERMTGGLETLVQTRIALSLFDVDYWNYNASGRVPDEQRRYGVSYSRPDKNGLNHNVLFITGLPRPRFLSVCAHELTHLWINENLNKDRTLDPDTCEAICELIAYKYMEVQKCAEEQERIRKNTYTHGKIIDFIKWEHDLGLFAIFDWIRNGTGSVFDPAKLDNPKPVSLPVWNMATVPKELPVSLRLKGVSGSKLHPMVMINDRNFTKGEEKEVELKDKKTLVRCLEISEDSAIIQLDGSTNRITLRLGN